MPSILNPGSATDNASFTGAADGALTIQSGPYGAKINALAFAADGTPTFSVTPVIPAAPVIAGRSLIPVPVRQTVLSGPVDSSGFSAFGGSTGSTTVTASGTLISTAANGFDINGQFDRIGSITNPSWTGLSTNGTMYLFLDIAANGTCTTGSTTLLPTYQWGGTYSTTNNQFTFNIQAMSGQVGNGSSAVQTNRVFVGEVTVAGGVTTAIVWYALMGRYKVEQATLAVGTQYSFNHNIGVADLDTKSYLYCKTADAGYSIGDRLYQTGDGNYGSGSAYGGTFSSTTYKTVVITTGTTGVGGISKSGVPTSFVAANWGAGVLIERGW